MSKEKVTVSVDLDKWERIYNALEVARDNAMELMNQVDDGVSSMTKREKAIAEMYRKEYEEATDLATYAKINGAVPF